MRRFAHAILLLAVCATRAEAQYEAQYFGLEMNRDSVKLGEVVELHARVYIGPQQTLVSHTPVSVEGLPDGGRIVGMDTLEHQADRKQLLGTVRLAFLRTGRLRIPPFRVIVRATPYDRGFVLESEPLYIDVIPTLPAGSPALKDIRDQVPAQTIDPVMVAGASRCACIPGVADPAAARPPLETQRGGTGRGRGADAGRSGPGGPGPHRAGRLDRSWRHGPVL
jgi:hypothetical protein